MANRANRSRRGKRNREQEKQRMMRSKIRKFSGELKRLREQGVHSDRREPEEARRKGGTLHEVEEILRDGMTHWINGLLR